MRRRTTGFTLIELMIVIGILLVLMVALIPAIGMFQERANRFACQANLSQHMYKAAMTYSTEPELNGNMPDGAGKDVLQNFLIYGFIENASQIVCPASTHTPTRVHSKETTSEGGEGGEGDSIWDEYFNKRAEITGGQLKDTQYSYKWTIAARKNGDGKALAADRDKWHGDRYNVLYSNGRVETTRKTSRVTGWSDLE